jgi:hypothetical protein
MLFRALSTIYGERADAGVVTDSLDLNWDPGSSESSRERSSKAYDISGKQRDAPTSNGSSVYVGNVYRFTGSGVFIYLSPYETNGLSVLSIEFWVNPDSLADNSTVFRIYDGDTYVNIDFRFSTADSQYRILYRKDGSSYSELSSLSLSLGTWYHVAICFGATDVRIYQNSTLVSTYSATGSFYSTGTGTFLQVGSGNGAFDGDIGYFRIYTKELSSGEVSQNFEATRARFGV